MHRKLTESVSDHQYFPSIGSYIIKVNIDINVNPQRREMRPGVGKSMWSTDLIFVCNTNPFNNGWNICGNRDCWTDLFMSVHRVIRISDWVQQTNTFLLPTINQQEAWWLYAELFLFLFCSLDVWMSFIIFINVQLLWLLHSIGPSP